MNQNDHELDEISGIKHDSRSIEQRIKESENIRFDQDEEWLTSIIEEF